LWIKVSLGTIATMEHHYPTLSGDIIKLDGYLRIERPDGLRCCLGGLSGAVGDAIDALSHPVPRPQQPQLSASDEVVLDRLLQDLSNRGLLPRPDTDPPLRVALIGSCDLALQVGTALLGLPVRLAVYHCEPPRRSPAETLNHIEPRPIIAALRRVAAERATTVTTGGHWTALSPAVCDLAVIAADTVAIDRAISEVLLRREVPQLAVTAHLDSAVVGPLTDGRGGACLICTDHFRSDFDPDWPLVVSELGTLAARPQPPLTRWAAAEVALAAHWFRQGHNVLRSLTLHADLAHPGVTRRKWLPHPECSCAPQASPVPEALRVAA
jgi:hypothetical protein